MNNPNFTDAELETIRQIAIQLYLDTTPHGKGPDNYNFQVAAEATYVYLRRMGMLKDAT